MGTTDAGVRADSEGGTEAGRGPDALGVSGRLETLVREDEAVAATCPYCDRPFGVESARDLHVGEVHSRVWSDEERRTYEAAREDERDDLFYFHLRVVAALGVLYAFIVLLYMLALGSNVI
jgi:hypothetical protein